MKNTRAEANAVAKTGSISNVRALSGYVRRDGDTRLLDPRQQLHDPRDRELDRRPGGRTLANFLPRYRTRNRQYRNESKRENLQQGSLRLLIEY